MAISTADRETLLRRIALSDPDLLTSPRAGADPARTLDPRWQTMVRLGALLATGSSATSLHQVVDEALALNITQDEIVLALVCLLPTVGLRQASAAAPALGLAIGYDVESALGVA